MRTLPSEPATVSSHGVLARREQLYEAGTAIANLILPMIGQPGAPVVLPTLELVVRESVRRTS